MSADQLGFDFTIENSATDELTKWRVQRRAAMEALALREGIPLGHRVRVEFDCGPPLEGVLLLNEEVLFLPERRNPRLHLRIGRADFYANEITACVQID